MIDAYLADAADFDDSTDSDSEFGGAAAVPQAVTFSPDAGTLGSHGKSAAEPPAIAAPSPMSAHGDGGGIRSSAPASSRETSLADETVEPAAGQLPQGWKLAECASEEDMNRLGTLWQTAEGGRAHHNDAALMARGWTRFLGMGPKQSSCRTQRSMQLPVRPVSCLCAMFPHGTHGHQSFASLMLASNPTAMP